MIFSKPDTFSTYIDLIKQTTGKFRYFPINILVTGDDEGRAVYWLADYFPHSVVYCVHDWKTPKDSEFFTSNIETMKGRIRMISMHSNRFFEKLKAVNPAPVFSVAYISKRSDTLEMILDCIGAYQHCGTGAILFPDFQNHNADLVFDDLMGAKVLRFGQSEFGKCAYEKA